MIYLLIDFEHVVKESVTHRLDTSSTCTYFLSYNINFPDKKKFKVSTKKIELKTFIRGIKSILASPHSSVYEMLKLTFLSFRMIHR